MFKAHIKLIVLEELNKEKCSGYDLIKSIGEFGKKPSSGYIYPLLGDLKKKGFVSMKKDGRKNIYYISRRGQTFLKNLRNVRRVMLEKMVKIWEPIAGKEIIERFKNNQKGDRPSLKDISLIRTLHELIFSFYKTKRIKQRKEMKKILKETIGKLEDIK